MSDAEALDARSARIAALLGEGKTDWRAVRLIIRRTALVIDDALVAKLDRSLAARIGKGHGWSRRRIVKAVDATVYAIDPDAVRERRETAEDRRRIGINALGNGMAEVYGTVAAATATAFDLRLSQLAKQVCAADPGTLDQSRANALAALTRGRPLACACGRHDCPARADVGAERDRGGARVVVNVIAGAETFSTTAPRPKQVRRSTNAASVLIADPVTSPVGPLRYQPSAALERAIRCRDLTCRFPGASARPSPATSTTPSPSATRTPRLAVRPSRGPLKCLCRHQHRLKPFTVVGVASNWKTLRWYGLHPRGGCIGRRRPGRPVPTTTRAGVRGVAPTQEDQDTAAKRTNRPGAQA